MVLVTRAPRYRDSEGAVTILVALFTCFIFFGLAALVVDLGFARSTKLASQNNSDAAALAAANVLYPAGGSCADHVHLSPCFDDAVQAAKTYAQTNFGVTDWSRCPATPPSGFSFDSTYADNVKCVAFDDMTHPSRVWMVTPTRDVPANFAAANSAAHGEANGTSVVPVSTSAKATVGQPPVPPCGLCVIGTGVHNIQNGNLEVRGSSVYMNGSLQANPGGGINTPSGSTNVEGTVTGTGTYTPAPKTGQPRVEDPLANKVLPSSSNNWLLPTTTSTLLKTNPCTEGPGYYYTVSPSPASCTWLAGTYVITGYLDKQVVNAPNGTTLFFACSGAGNKPVDCPTTGQTGGGIHYSGNAQISLTAPASGPLQGLAIAYDRYNTQDAEFKGGITGNIKGTFYARSAQVLIGGNSNTTLDSIFVVNDIALNGTTTKLTLDLNLADQTPFDPVAPSLTD